jgi:hypothetical protein
MLNVASQQRYYALVQTDLDIKYPVLAAEGVLVGGCHSLSFLYSVAFDTPTPADLKAPSKTRTTRKYHP